MKMIGVVLLSCAICFIGGYICGKNKAKVKIAEKQVEVVKHVAQKRAKIQAQPNADRSELLELMRAGRL
ncbi:MAG: hypothetical protein IJ852_01815 [Alphaproteobacteria bacterium]|nr:hypothetical protein [Alphaproteobacteria bacterium]